MKALTLLALVLAFGLAACGSASERAADPDPTAVATDCLTVRESAPQDCDAAHPMAMYCEKNAAAQPAGCVPGLQADQVWCCAPPPAPTCQASAAAGGKQLWHFENAADKPGAPSDCADLGDGWFECSADACLVVPYTGTCPAC